MAMRSALSRFNSATRYRSMESTRVAIRDLSYCKYWIQSNEESMDYELLFLFMPGSVRNLEKPMGGGLPCSLIPLEKVLRSFYEWEERMAEKEKAEKEKKAIKKLKEVEMDRERREKTNKAEKEKAERKKKRVLRRCDCLRFFVILNVCLKS
ncbi:hypothetical protein POUND7_008295, partial [Theobroma cacao]